MIYFEKMQFKLAKVGITDRLHALQVSGLICLNVVPTPDLLAKLGQTPLSGRDLPRVRCLVCPLMMTHIHTMTDCPHNRPCTSHQEIVFLLAPGVVWCVRNALRGTLRRPERCVHTIRNLSRLCPHSRDNIDDPFIVKVTAPCATILRSRKTHLKDNASLLSIILKEGFMPYFLF